MESRLSVGLRAWLEFLAADPPLARLLLVDEHDLIGPPGSGRERLLDLLEGTLRPVPRHLLGGMVSYLSARVRAGEAEQLTDGHAFLMEALSSRYTF